MITRYPEEMPQYVPKDVKCVTMMSLQLSYKSKHIELCHNVTLYKVAISNYMRRNKKYNYHIHGVYCYLQH